MSDKFKKSDDQWRTELTEEQYRITRQCGTEKPFSGKYNDFKEEGMFVCVACKNELFDSDSKFNSGSGWPSFYQPVDTNNVDEVDDSSLGMKRTEIKCDRCGAHLGHLFDDGPTPTGLRYCINSGALDFVPDKRDSTDKTDSSKTE